MTKNQLLMLKPGDKVRVISQECASLFGQTFVVHSKVTSKWIFVFGGKMFNVGDIERV